MLAGGAGGRVLAGGCWRAHSGTNRLQASTKLLKSVATEVLKLCELVPIQADIVPLADIRVLLHTLRDKATPSRPRFHLLLHSRTCAFRAVCGWSCLCGRAPHCCADRAVSFRT